MIDRKLVVFVPFTHYILLFLISVVVDDVVLCVKANESPLGINNINQQSSKLVTA